MTVKILLILCVLASTSVIKSQSIEEVRSDFESFEYLRVISSSNKILQNDSTLSVDDKVELYTMKGASFYSNGNTDSSRAAFIDLLKLDPEYNLDPVRTSPKIITFFNGIKNEFIEISNSVLPVESASVNPKLIPVFNNRLYTNAIVRSIIVPGLGQLYADDTPFNWIFTTLGAANMGAMVYFIVETNNLESKYLNETSLTKIPGRYEDYNNAYKLRNILIGSFAALWIYSQVDLLFFSDELFTKQIEPGLSLNRIGGNISYNLEFKFHF